MPNGANKCPQALLSHLKAQNFWKSQAEIGVEIKYLFKVFILHLLLSSCLLAEKGSILCRGQRTTDAHLVSYLSMNVWEQTWSPTLQIISLVGMQTSTWAQAKAHLEHVEGRGGTSTCITPSQGSKNMASLCIGGDGSFCCCAGGCMGIGDARNITQVPLMSALFSFTTNQNRIILSHVCIVLWDFWLEKKLLKDLSYYSHEQISWRTRDLLALLCWNPTHQKV